jgi:hypothetical protein
MSTRCPIARRQIPGQTPKQVSHHYLNENEVGPISLIIGAITTRFAQRIGEILAYMKEGEEDKHYRYYM